jgi:hypothetical protein
MPEARERITDGLMRNALKILVEKPDGKTELGRHTQEDNIKTNLQNKKCERC